MRASRQIHEEVSYEMYANLELVFTISPNPYRDPDPMVCLRHPRWGDVNLLSLSKDPVEMRHRWEEKTGACRSWVLYENMPLHRFKAIRVQLYPPDCRDPGQLIKLWGCVRRVSDLLLHCNAQLPSIHMAALTQGSVTWGSSISIRHPRTKKRNQKKSSSDLCMCLVAFWPNLIQNKVCVHALRYVGDHLMWRATERLGLVCAPLDTKVNVSDEDTETSEISFSVQCVIGDEELDKCDPSCGWRYDS